MGKERLLLHEYDFLTVMLCSNESLESQLVQKWRVNAALRALIFFFFWSTNTCTSQLDFLWTVCPISLKKNALIFAAPPIKFCTDNGVMIAWAGVERALKGLFNELDFKPRPRWPLDENAPKAAGAGGVKA